MRVDSPLIALGMAGAALVLWANSVSGLAMVHLGMHNAVAAECLLRGEVWQTTRGEVFAHWPPLFVLLLAAGRALGASYEMTARVLHAVSLATTVMLAVTWSRRLAPTSWVGWLAGAALLLQPSLLALHGTLASEPLFLALVLGSLVSAQEYSERPRGSMLALTTVLAGLACLQRYVGVVDVAVLAALGWWSWPRSTRLRDLAVLLVGSLAPLSAWLVRNVLRTGALTGFRPPSETELEASLLESWSALGFAWTGSADVSRSGALLAASTILLALAGGLTLLAKPSLRRRGVWALAFPAAYLVFLVGVASWIWLDPLDARLLSPLIVFSCLLAPVGAHALLELGRVRLPRFRPYLAAAASAGAVLFLASGILGVRERMRLVQAAEPHAGSQESELVHWLREHPLEGEVHSNAPEAYALATWRPARLVPTRRVSETLLALPTAQFPLTLVWFDPKGMMNLDDVRRRKRLSIEAAHEFADGAILEVRRRGP